MILALIVAAIAGARLYFGPEVVTIPVIRSDLVTTVVATGHVETPYRVDVASQIIGTVSDVLVEEGQKVYRGQPLVMLERSELESAVVQAEGLVAQAEAKLRQVRELTGPAAVEALKQARATLANAEASYERADQLVKSGHGTQSALDAAKRDLDVAQTQVRTAELQVFTTSPGGSQTVVAETELKQAQAALQATRVRLGYSIITAPRDGILISRSVEKGTVVQPGKVLMVLAPTGDTQVVVQIDERNLSLLAIGQSALVSADAYPDKQFPAHLSYINPGVDIARASVEVKLRVDDPPDYLRQDMTVSVDIEAQRRVGVLVAPVRAIHDLGSGAPWVLVVRQGRPREQAVRIGLRGNAQVEVVEGLVAGDQLVPLGTGVRAGQRIRAVPP
ncbi:efflux RND transporter periplasmic adaptor subunit [Alsobacter sp. R-9]